MSPVHKSNQSNSKLTLKRKLTRSICKHTAHGKNTATQKATIRNTTALKNSESFTNTHNECMAEISDQFNFSILRTSRQIHCEAALLFYQHNTFTFDHIIDLEAFLGFLIPAQVRAVQSSVFVYHHSRAFAEL